MLSRKNAFESVAVSIYLTALVYALGAGLVSLGAGQEYPYLLSGVFLLLMPVGWLLLVGIASLTARLDARRRFRDAMSAKYAEAVVVAAVLALALALRLWVVYALPMQVESDYKTYYEIAELILRGTLRTEGAGYCDYISLFPHVYGYAFALSRVLRVFGASVRAAQLFNVSLSVMTVFATYWAAREAGGRLCGMVALVLAALWPSQILFVNMVASEYLFSFMLMVGLCVFVRASKACSGDAKHPLLALLAHAFLGVWLALAAAVRPMALLLVITIVLCALFESFRLPVRPAEEQPLSLVLLSKGWVRCFALVAAYLLTGALVSLAVEGAVDRELASTNASFGYNLLVGLNRESGGGWNQADSDALQEALARTGSAEEAQLACRDLAVQRLNDPAGVLDLFVYKFQTLWMNDDYGTTWNLLFMDQQGTLTAQRERFLYAARSWGNVFYLTALLLAMIAGIGFWQARAALANPFLLLFLGTVAMHLLVESQNRYHFHALYALAVLAAFGVRSACEAAQARVLRRQERRRLDEEERRKDERRKEVLERERQMLARLRREAMSSRFDLEDAIKRGLVTVRVTKAYARESGADDAKARDGQDGGEAEHAEKDG